jgi:ABC-type sulfate/molybdate transport systems ATPase subunit
VRAGPGTTRGARVRAAAHAGRTAAKPLPNRLNEVLPPCLRGRGEFRERILLRVWEETDKTVVMVTHDVDEALYLADRLILMTDGPEAMVGQSLTVPFPRPRRRAAVLGHAEYHRSRRQVIDFLEHHAHQSGRARSTTC